jgi:TrmH family RNA methyltransferase
MGSEGKGISADIINYIDNKLYIPEYPLGVRSSESLNVAVATSIICSEFRRRSLSK